MNKWVYTFGAGKAQGGAKQKELLGGKGANLAEMSNIGIPVPPGFTITTKVCNYYYDNNENYPSELNQQVLEAVKNIEKITKMDFGGKKFPLLLSVRSGARASMPGMMDTVLNLGLNDETVKGLSKESGDGRFAYDSYRRFIQMYGDVVLGIDSIEFEEIIEQEKRSNNIILDTEVTKEIWENITILFKKLVKEKTGIQFGEKNLLVTYHSVTLEHNSSQKQFQVLLDVLDEMKDIQLIFTMPNSDSDSRIIKKMIDEFVYQHSDRSIAFTSMGHFNYLSTLQYVDGVVGNSSSGLIEAPSFKTGTINIGDRQEGRLKAQSVIDCEPEKASIEKSVKKLFSKDFQKLLAKTENPYGEGDTTMKIIEILEKTLIPKSLKKKFYNL